MESRKDPEGANLEREQTKGLDCWLWRFQSNASFLQSTDNEFHLGKCTVKSSLHEHYCSKDAALSRFALT